MPIDVKLDPSEVPTFGSVLGDKDSHRPREGQQQGAGKRKGNDRRDRRTPEEPEQTYTPPPPPEFDPEKHQRTDDVFGDW